MEFMDWIEIPRVDNVKFTRQIFDTIQNQLISQTLDGSICLTSHHLLFTTKQNKKDEEIWILHSLIDSLEPKIRETKFQLAIKCKNFQIYQIDFPSLSICQSINKSLDLLSNLTSENMKFPFFNQLSSSLTSNESAYWSIHKIEDTFNDFFSEVLVDDANKSEWRISEVNKSYKVCPSYPTKVIVPKNVDDSYLIKSSQFRAGGRFPVLSYFHKKTKSFVLRSSQPLLGPSNKRCKEDESLLKTALPMGKQGYIYDLRDANILKTAVSKGGGFETDANYPLWKRINRHLDRFDQLQTSFSKLIDACLGESSVNTDRYLNKLESSTWFYSIRQALYLAYMISDELHNKNGCVLIHDWDGTDNTLLITSLIQIILNPDTRTIKGFQKLIEREWLEAGHSFSRRCFKGPFGSSQAKQEGPVFLLFLDCIRQLMEQYCISFEFNEELLIILYDNTMAPQYGTFLGNCQRERDELSVSTRTLSLWSYVNSGDVLKNITNPLYEHNSAALWPSVYGQVINLWSGLYLRHQRNENPFKEAKNEIFKLVDLNKKAKANVEKLRNELAELEKEAVKRGVLGENELKINL